MLNQNPLTPMSTFPTEQCQSPMKLRRQSSKIPGPTRLAFTLTEVLIAVVLTLILLGLMIRAFSLSGEEIAKGRALLEMAGQLRSTTELLRRDLGGATANIVTRNHFGNATGYFEYIEGLSHDSTIHTFPNGNNDGSAVYGDIDDILMFTARSLDQPFRGRFAGQIVESTHAEIVWWTVFEDENGDLQFNVGEPLQLYRRVLLIRPDLTTTATDISEFQQFNDVSARLDPNGNVLTNSLSDLTDRANRFARAGSNFPHEPNYALLQGTTAFTLSNPTPSGGAVNLAEGEDIMLSGLTAFDVQAFDPVVQMRQSPDGLVGLAPNDFGYASGVASGFGGYVDLNFGIGNGIFTRPPGLPAPDDNSIVWTNPVYCTWSLHYESDGVDQDNDSLIDEARNGLDDDLANGPDDVQENETQPPYPFPLRGVKVTIRIGEQTSQIVRQTTVIANFVPE